MKKILFISLAAAALTALSSCQDKVEPEKDTQFFDSEELAVNKPADAAEEYKIGISASETVSWTAVLDQTYAWITLDNATGKGDGEIVYSLAENTEIQPRTANIKVSASSDINDFKSEKAIKIVQIGTAPALLITPSGEVEVPADEDEAYTIEVTSNLAWTTSIAVQSDEGEWIRIVSGQNGENGGNIVLSIAKNETKDYRSAEITVSNAEYPDLTQKLVVKQQFADMTYRIPLNGVSGYVAAGEYTMSLSGYATPLPVNVFEEDGNTIIEYSELLEPGEYRVEALSGDSDYEIGASFILGENGVITEIAEWSAALKMFGGTEKWPFMLGSYDNLVALKEAVAAGDNFSGKYFAQSADIAMPEEAWDGIGVVETSPFSGIYDGNNHEITNLKIAPEDNNGHGFFNYVKGEESSVAIIKNLVVRGTVAPKTNTAVFAGKVNDWTNIINCVSHASITVPSGAQGVSGIATNVFGKGIVLDGCKNYGTITAINKNANCSGIVGWAKGASAKDVVIIRNCRNYGACTFSANAGGIVGTAAGNLLVEKCANYGAIENTVSAQRVGCIAGTCTGPVTISECFNIGDFTCMINNGGIVGFSERAVTIKNCYNKGNITVSKKETKPNNANIGGVIGHMKKDGDTGVVECCYCSGSFAGGTGACGVAGSNTAGSISADNLIKSYYLADSGYKRGSNQVGDAAGVVEAKDEAWFTSGTAIDGWDPAIWEFKAGLYPTLKNNPED